MNFSTVKSIAIPEGNATSFSIGGVKVWGGGSGGDEPAELYSWEGVAYHINKGTYKDVYAIGDMVPLDLGSEGLINMQIAAFDKDILADGSGTAAITWVGKELLATKKRMNPSLSGTTEGTGTIGGWEKCELRDYLKNTIKPLLPSVVVGLIEFVSKSQTAHDTAGSSFAQTTEDDVWIPRRTEVNGSYELFATSSNRIKYIAGSATTWWVRNVATSLGSFYTVGASGSTSSIRGSSGNLGVCLCFCTGRTPT